MRFISRIITAVTLFLCGAAAYAVPERPVPQRLVNDFAGIFTGEQAQMLENVLVAFDDSTSNQIAVVTVKDLEGYEPAEYAVRIGLDWGVGSSDFNNGIVLLVKPKTEDSRGQVSIQVGYGLEGAVTDARCKRIITLQMIPNFQKDDYFTGVYDAVQVLMQIASGEYSESRSGDDDSLGGILSVALLLLFLFVVVMAIREDKKKGGNNRGGGRRASRTFDSGPVIFPGSFGGLSGGGSSGGGFGGFGGGSFGGGGASGSW